jgi:nitrite reductase/ring-hydroxylating ferredoxin subunit
VIDLCATDEIGLGECRRFELEGRPPIAVFHLHDGYFAIDDQCSHGVASLAEGEIDLEDGVVECPWHQGAFEIATGRPCGAPCVKPQKTHVLAIAQGRIQLAD